MKKYNIFVFVFICLLLLSLPVSRSRINWQLIYILIFAGGFSNTVGIADIANEAFGDHKKWFTRPLLVAELFIFSWILGADSWFLLRNVKEFLSLRFWFSIAVIAATFIYVALKKPTNITFGGIFFIFLVIVSLHIFPDTYDLLRPMISRAITKIFGQTW